jgi:hypothetical protein
MPRYDSLAGSDRDAFQVGTYELDYRYDNDLEINNTYEENADPALQTA